MCRRNKGQSRRRRLICSRRRACSEEFKLTMIGEGTAVSGATLGGLALSGVAKEVCRCPYQFLPSVRPMPWFDLAIADGQSSSGGGISNQGSLQVLRSTVMNNHSHISGGGIHHSGTWLYL